MRDVLDQIIANLADAELSIQKAITDATGEERDYLQDELDILDGIIDRLKSM